MAKPKGALTVPKRNLICEIDRILKPSKGFVYLDALSIDLPGQPKPSQAVSIEGGAVMVSRNMESSDGFFVPLSDLPFVDLRALLEAAKWCQKNGGIEIEA